jgi:hypothetical protein
MILLRELILLMLGQVQLLKVIVEELILVGEYFMVRMFK